MEKEINIYIPENLAEVNLAFALVFNKVMKIEDLSDSEKVLQMIAHLNNIDIDILRVVSTEQILSVSNQIMELFINIEKQTPPIDDIRIITIDGQEFGLIPNFDKMETGAYIDISQDLIPDLDNNLHKLMAVLYRPIEDKKKKRYRLQSYSDESRESVEERENLFLNKMPYIIVRSVVNFMLSHIVK